MRKSAFLLLALVLSIAIARGSSILNFDPAVAEEGRKRAAIERNLPPDTSWADIDKFDKQNISKGKEKPANPPPQEIADKKLNVG